MAFQENPQIVGYIQKTHGVHGGFMVEAFQSMPEIISIPKWAFVELDGGLVPYRMKHEECFLRDDRHMVIFLDGIDSPELGVELLQAQIFFPESFFKGVRKSDDLPIIGKGFRVVLEGHDESGEFIEMLEIPGNPLMSIDINGREILIPANSEFIQKIDTDSQTLYLRVSEELLDLN